MEVLIVSIQCLVYRWHSIPNYHYHDWTLSLVSRDGVSQEIRRSSYHHQLNFSNYLRKKMRQKELANIYGALYYPQIPSHLVAGCS